MDFNPPYSWLEGQPNDVGGNQNCIFSEVNSHLVGDIDCDLRLCPLCQVRLGSVFQFSGLCQEENDVDVLFLLKVNILKLIDEFTEVRALMHKHIDFSL